MMIIDLMTNKDHFLFTFLFLFSLDLQPFFFCYSPVFFNDHFYFIFYFVLLDFIFCFLYFVFVFLKPCHVSPTSYRLSSISSQDSGFISHPDYSLNAGTKVARPNRVCVSQKGHISCDIYSNKINNYEVGLAFKTS